VGEKLTLKSKHFRVMSMCAHGLAYGAYITIGIIERQQFSTRNRPFQANHLQHRQNKDKSGSNSTLLSEGNRLIGSATFREVF